MWVCSARAALRTFRQIPQRGPRAGGIRFADEHADWEVVGMVDDMRQDVDSPLQPEIFASIKQITTRSTNLGFDPIVSIQGRYNVLDRVVETETVPMVTRFKLAMMAYAPLSGGMLLDLGVGHGNLRAGLERIVRPSASSAHIPLVLQPSWNL